MIVQCAGSGSAWALDIGPGAAASQTPHIGYHAGPGGAVPIFAEQYFPHPGVIVSAASPGPYPAALSALSSSAAVYVGYCSPCGYGTGPWDLVTGDGATLSREGNVGELNQPVAASFLTPALGWVVGTYIDNRDPSRPRRYWRVVTTSDGGRTWQVDYTSAGLPGSADLAWRPARGPRSSGTLCALGERGVIARRAATGSWPARPGSC